VKLLARAGCRWQFEDMSGDDTPTATALRVERDGHRLVLGLPEVLDDASVALLWDPALRQARSAEVTVEVDCAAVKNCGGAGFALLMALQEQTRSRGGTMKLQSLSPAFRDMYEAMVRGQIEEPRWPERDQKNAVTKIGHAVARRAEEWCEDTVFIGEVGMGLADLARNPRRLRLREWWVMVEKAGTDALPIVGLISFLMGMIMAFQAAMPMRQFGVDIFVVNLVALATARELGPIMTAIVLAGRSGSAFAAEIGTMKVNEEVAALTTMGLSPVRFLAVPRVLAGVVVTPLLTIYAVVIGIAGGLFVMLVLGFPLATLMHQLSGALELKDVGAGLIKSFFFGATVAGVGCLRGLQTGAGAAAVGASTTRAVVTSIFLIVLLDAVFAVVYYQIKF